MAHGTYYNCSISVTSTQGPHDLICILSVPAQAFAPNCCAVKAVPGLLTGICHLFPGRWPCRCTCQTAVLAHSENA